MTGICCSLLKLPISFGKSLYSKCGQISYKYAFYIYTITFMIFTTFGWLFYECPHWKAHPSVHDKKFIINNYTIYGIFVAYAFFAAFTIYHLVHVLLFQFLRIFTATAHGIHANEWIIKLLFLVIIISSLYFIPYKPLHFYGLFSVILSFFYLLFQGFSLFCLSRLISSHLLEKYETTYSSFWAVFAMGYSTLSYIIIITVHIVLYAYFVAVYTYALIAASLIICVTLCILRLILLKESIPFGLLEPSILSLYITYLTIKGILLNTGLVSSVGQYNNFYISVRVMDVSFMVTSLISSAYIIQQLYRESSTIIATTDVEEQIPQTKMIEIEGNTAIQSSISRTTTSDQILEQVDQIVLGENCNNRVSSPHLLLCLFHGFLMLCSCFYYTVVTDYMTENTDISKPPVRMVAWGYDTARIIICSYLIFIIYSVYEIRKTFQSFKIN